MFWNILRVFPVISSGMPKPFGNYIKGFLPGVPKEIYSGLSPGIASEHLRLISPWILPRDF